MIGIGRNRRSMKGGVMSKTGAEIILDAMHNGDDRHEIHDVVCRVCEEYEMQLTEERARLNFTLENLEEFDEYVWWTDPDSGPSGNPDEADRVRRFIDKKRGEGR